MAEETQAIGIEAGGAAMLFEAGANEAEVIPGGIGCKAASEDLSAMIIGGEDEALERVGRPPSVRGRIVLEEFADGSGFPASPRFRTGSPLADEPGIMLLDVLSDGRAGADEIKAAAELIGNEGIVKRLGQREDLLEEPFDRLGPELLVITAGGFGPEGGAVFEPSGAQPIQLRPAKLESFAGGGTIHLAAVEQS